MYLCDSSINSRKGLSEGPKCKTVSPQGASRVPGIDLSTVVHKPLLSPFSPVQRNPSLIDHRGRDGPS
jgi:hypothetical protein